MDVPLYLNSLNYDISNILTSILSSRTILFEYISKAQNVYTKRLDDLNNLSETIVWRHKLTCYISQYNMLLASFSLPIKSTDEELDNLIAFKNRVIDVVNVNNAMIDIKRIAVSPRNNESYYILNLDSLFSTTHYFNQYEIDNMLNMWIALLHQSNVNYDHIAMLFE